MKKLFSHLKNPRVRRTVILIVVILALLGSIFYWLKTQGRVSIENSLIQSPIISISPENPSKLLEMDVYEGEQVKKGDQLGITDSQTLRADTDGLIVMANTQIGSVVSLQSPAVQLIQLSDLRVAGTIDENKGLADITVGQIVSFTIDALPGQTFWGYVDEISPSAKQTQLAFSISSERPTQQFVVFARFDASKYPQIKNGMSAKMLVYTQTNE